MTGVFVADAIRDLPQSLAHPKDYVVRYYCQYPALGLIAWPPLFYFVEGLVMLVCGPQFWVARLCIAGFAVLALGYTYRYARLSLPHGFAVLAVAVTALSPGVFVYSQRVMLEVPTLAFVIAAVTHFEHYLRDRRGRDAISACVLAACAALTRFDGVVLALYFALRLLVTRNWGLLLKRPVWVGLSLALLLTVPYYALTWKLYGSGISTAASSGTTPDSTSLRLVNFVFYPLAVPRQTSWVSAVLAFIGLIVSAVRNRSHSGPAFALLASVYLLFTPLAQLDERHAIYWLPAVAVLGCQAVRFVAEQWGQWLATALAVGLIVAGGGECRWREFRTVFGYEEATRWMLAHRTTERPIVADGFYSGSIVYHTRLHDPERRVWIVRGDKLLYAMFSDPGSQYKQYANSQADVLERLERVDPEFVVIEDPPPTFAIVPGVELLRSTLHDHPEKYEAAHVVSLRTNYEQFVEPGTRLMIFRKRHRNPNAVNTVEIELIGLGRTVETAR